MDPDPGLKTLPQSEKNHPSSSLLPGLLPRKSLVGAPYTPLQHSKIDFLNGRFRASWPQAHTDWDTAISWLSVTELCRYVGSRS